MNHPRPNPIILVPIRYPLTAQSTQTLEQAQEIAAESNTAELTILHVNLYQYGDSTTTREIHRAIEPIVGDKEVTVNVARGFLIEEVICEEVANYRADIVVLGRNQKVLWRRVLSRIAGNEPAIVTHLRENTDASIEVVG